MNLFFVKHLQQTERKKLAYDIGERSIKNAHSNKLHENVSRYLNIGPAEEVKNQNVSSRSLN